MRIALYGGSFDPPHVGHQLVCLYVLATKQVDLVWLMPCASHPFGKQSLSFEHRLEMCRLAARVLPQVSVCSIEGELPTPSYTLRTVQALKKKQPADEFVIVIGEDVAPGLPTWYGWEELSRLVEFVVVGREGSQSSLNFPIRMPNVNSTHIRTQLAQGQLPTDLVPTCVLDYIQAHHLYVRPAADPLSTPIPVFYK